MIDVHPSLGLPELCFELSRNAVADALHASEHIAHVRVVLAQTLGQRADAAGDVS